MEALRALNKELMNPGVQKLLAAARTRGIPATKAQAQELQKERVVKQLFAQPPPQKGAHAANENGKVFQADLASFSQYDPDNNKGFSYFLLVVDVFTREARSKEIISNTAQETWEAFADILEDWRKCQIVHVDDGGEFGQLFVDNARRNGIIVSTKEPEDLNGISVVDTAMKWIKDTMFEEMAEDETTSWIPYLETATKAYNATPHGTTYKMAPKDVNTTDGNVVKFRLYQDNAEKLKRNAKQMNERRAKLEASGAFRPMLPRSEWQRSFKPRFSGTALPVQGFEGGYVKSGGKRYAMGRVRPALPGQNKNIPAALAKGSETRNKNAREEMQEYVPALKKFLRNGAEPPTNVGKFLNEKWEFPEKIKKLRLGNAMGFVRLFPEEFEINKNGNVRNKTAYGDRRKIGGFSIRDEG